MARKSNDAKGGADSRHGLKVVRSAVEAPAPVSGEMFGENRSGRDRREDEGPTEDSRRVSTSERRKGNVKQAAWWLERDYVESHHFVQKSSSNRSRQRPEDQPED